jgi:hypothetical protein
MFDALATTIANRCSNCGNAPFAQRITFSRIEMLSHSGRWCRGVGERRRGVVGAGIRGRCSGGLSGVRRRHDRGIVHRPGAPPTGRRDGARGARTKSCGRPAGGGRERTERPPPGSRHGCPLLSCPAKKSSNGSCRSLGATATMARRWPSSPRPPASGSRVRTTTSPTGRTTRVSPHWLLATLLSSRVRLRGAGRRGRRDSGGFRAYTPRADGY